MALVLRIHPDNPQQRLLQQAAEIIKQGGVVVYPTDSTYAIGCHWGDKQAVDRIRKIRQLSEQHHMTVVCRNLSELGHYARVGNHTFRLMKKLLPGPYTFILKATKEVPKRLQHPKRRSIGLRMPDNPILQELLALIEEPLLSSSLIMPGDNEALLDPDDIIQLLDSRVDLIIDGGWLGTEMSTIIDAYDDEPEIIRSAKGAEAAAAAI